jgi:diguanylate cyclase (GGDEF)-like protein
VQDDALNGEIARLRSQLAEARAQNRDLQEKLAAALDGTGICLWQGQPQSGELTVFNLQAFKPGDMAPNFDRWLAKLHPEDRDAVLANYHAHLAGRSACYEAEYRTIGPDGEITWLWDHGRVVERAADGSAVRILGTHIDITRRKVAEGELERLAHNDPLTGLPNRNRFFLLLEQALQTEKIPGRQLAVLFVDLDYFKQVNDRHGHAFGDRVLLAVADHLRHIVRDGDTVARLGGDEFTVLLEGPTIGERAAKVARRIVHALESPLEIDGLSVHIGASIGVSIYPEHGGSAEALMRFADAAMYDAKSGGRRRIVCYQPDVGPDG